MWDRRDSAKALTAAALLVALALVFPKAAHPTSAPPFTARDATAYMRGWIDGAAPAGYFTVAAACTRAKTGGYWCMAIVVKGHTRTCAKALLTGYKFPGPMQYGRCPKKTGPPA